MIIPNAIFIISPIIYTVLKFIVLCQDRSHLLFAGFHRPPITKNHIWRV